MTKATAGTGQPRSCAAWSIAVVFLAVGLGRAPGQAWSAAPASSAQDGPALRRSAYLPLVAVTADLPQPDAHPAPQDLYRPRRDHSATLLASGRVLVAGGLTAVDNEDRPASSVEILDLATGTWTEGAPLLQPRSAHSAVRLTDGTVLFAGGYTDRDNGSRTASAEVYFPALGESWAVLPMEVARANHCAVLLSDGRVLVAGGEQMSVGSPSVSVEIFDEAFLSWRSAAPAPVPLDWSACALLGDGRVLVVGGWTGSEPLSTSAVYDPPTDTWQRTGPMLESMARPHMGLVALRDGTALAVGSRTADGNGMHAEWFDPATLAWAAAGQPSQPREQLQLCALTDGRALLTGEATTSEVYDAVARAWRPAGRAVEPRVRHAVVPLPDGGALVIGGDSTWWPSGCGRGATSTRLGTVRASVERWDPASGEWSSATAEQRSRWYHTTTRLDDGRLLVTGGTYAGGPRDSAAILDPTRRAWSTTPRMHTARDSHTATLLPDGKVLVAGGLTDEGRSTARAEVFDPAVGTWTDTGALHAARHRHAAVALDDGRVLVLGGCSNDFSATGAPSPSAEIYDPAAGAWQAAAAPRVSGWGRTAVVLSDGTVLTAGGYDLTSDRDTDKAERYDPAADSWQPTAPLVESRYDHAAALLPDGGVLVTGGRYLDTRWTPRGRSSAAVYEPGTGFWSSTGPMTDVRGRSGHTLSVIGGGRALACGDAIFGPASTEILDLATRTWRAGSGMAVGRVGHTATVLAGGTVLVLGGHGDSLDQYQALMQVFEPDSERWSTVGELPPSRW